MKLAVALVGIGAFVSAGGCGGKVGEIAQAPGADASPDAGGDATAACSSFRCVTGGGVVLRQGELEDTWIRCGGKESPACGALIAAYEQGGCFTAHVDGASDTDPTLTCVVDWLNRVPRACADGTVTVINVCP